MELIKKNEEKYIIINLVLYNGDKIWANIMKKSKKELSKIYNYLKLPIYYCCLYTFLHRRIKNCSNDIIKLSQKKLNKKILVKWEIL